MKDTDISHAKYLAITEQGIKSNNGCALTQYDQEYARYDPTVVFFREAVKGFKSKDGFGVIELDMMYSSSVRKYIKSPYPLYDKKRTQAWCRIKTCDGWVSPWFRCPEIRAPTTHGGVYYSYLSICEVFFKAHMLKQLKKGDKK